MKKKGALEASLTSNQIQHLQECRGDVQTAAVKYCQDEKNIIFTSLSIYMYITCNRRMVAA